ncbi:MAG: NAD(P)H-dependent oxidoreductase subunit E [Hyphomicrobiales bacterium]|nr:NAD(P)H-dependent oxidoreductase subunit E [Hyphomicrobiales bacterium]
MADGSAGAPEKRRARKFARGRQVEGGALDEVRSLIGEPPHPRDRLIEHLHRLQDHFGCLTARHMRALAEDMRLPMAEVYEVATFYHHFTVVKEDDAAPPPVTVRLCNSVTCALHGADALIEEIRAKVSPDEVRVLPAPCWGLCDKAPAAVVGHKHFERITADVVAQAARARDVEPVIPAYKDFAAYRAEGGYALLEACRRGGYTPEHIARILLDANLRGLGGAGFPAGKKWGFVRAAPGPRYVAINADEGEPGTFKDRYYLERDPHRMIEGALIASWAMEAERCFLYVRDEYAAVLKLLAVEIAKLEEAEIVRPGYLDLRRGAGAYICGEESAMIESIEGNRGLPRHRPPYVAQVGVFGRPTLEHNAETVFWIREIVERGPEWFASQGRNGRKGLRSWSVSGRVKKPGVYLTGAGITMNELLNEYCGGMADGHTFKGYLPGGASGGILPASLADVPMDFGTLEQYGCFTGSGAVVVLSHEDDIKGVALNLLRFFEEESCGQCTPCRVGCEKAVKLMERDAWDEPLMMDLSQAMTDASICGLGQAAPNPIKSVFRYFRDDLASQPPLSPAQAAEKRNAGAYAKAEAPVGEMPPRKGRTVKEAGAQSKPDKLKPKKPKA